MHKLKQLKEERGALFTEIDGLIARSESEENFDDFAGIEERQNKVAQLDKNIEILEKAEKRAALDAQKAGEEEEARKAAAAAGAQGSDSDKKEARSFSYTKFLREAAEERKGTGKLTGFEAEMHQEGRSEMRNNNKGYVIPSVVLESRSLSAGGANTGAEFVPTDKVGFIENLRAKSVLSQAGATMLSNLDGNVSIPKQTSSITFSWLAENGAVSDSTPGTDSVELSPKRLAGQAILSNRLLNQSSVSVEQMVRNDIDKGAALAFDVAGLNGSGTGNVPEGILNTTGIGTVTTAALSWANIVAMETEVANDNADFGALKYIFNSAIRGGLKTTLKDAGSGLFLMENGEVNGYGHLVSNQMPANTLLFGNFNDVVMAQWGGLDIIVDPYTNAGTNEIVYTISMDGDIGIRHAESFCSYATA